MEKMQLNLSIPEVNLIIKSLSSLPYNQVFELIAQIREQAQNQIKKIELLETNQKEKAIKE